MYAFTVLSRQPSLHSHTWPSSTRPMLFCRHRHQSSLSSAPSLKVVVLAWTPTPHTHTHTHTHIDTHTHAHMCTRTLSDTHADHHARDEERAIVHQQSVISQRRMLRSEARHTCFFPLRMHAHPNTHTPKHTHPNTHTHTHTHTTFLTAFCRSARPCKPGRAPGQMKAPSM
jgi:hypothetical protein